MNLLIDPLPKTVSIGGVDYRIYTDFREYIEASLYAEDGNEEELLNFVLSLYIDSPKIDNLIEAVGAIYDFMSYTTHKDVQEENPKTGGRKSPVFSFSYDMEYVIADFRRYYGIDLVHVKYLHWYEFMALLKGLPSGSSVKERIMCRSVNLAEIKDKEERKRIRKIQNDLRIKTKAQDWMDIGDIAEAFL